MNLNSNAMSTVLQCPLWTSTRHLDANALSTVPRGSFKGLRALRFLWMDDNGLPQVPVAALASLPALQALSLALNHISHLPDLAFHTMRHLLVL